MAPIQSAIESPWGVPERVTDFQLFFPSLCFCFIRKRGTSYDPWARQESEMRIVRERRNAWIHVPNGEILKAHSTSAESSLNPRPSDSLMDN